MDKYVRRNIIRFLSYMIVQVVLLKRINIGFDDTIYVHFYLYPLIILLLPFRTPKTMVIGIAFFIGLIMDMFYDSIGIHTATLVFTAYARGFILSFLKPAEGYKFDGAPVIHEMGLIWTSSYIGIVLILHLFVYYSIDAFSFVYLKEILIKTFLSFVASFFLMIITQLIINPKY